MKNNHAKHHRRSIRLKGYDYSRAGAYFVTICVQDRLCLLGEVVDGYMHLSPRGRIVQAAWEDLPRHYPHVVLDAFCVMPNHVHGIIVLVDDGSGHGRGGSEQAENPPPQITPSGHEPLPDPEQTRPYPHPARHGLPEIVRAFKSFSARRINALRRMKGVSVWQRNYYEHIIQNKTEFERIADYIVNNPQKWEADQLHPSAPPNKFNHG